jgi:peptidase, M16 family
MKKYLLILALALFALSANAKRTQATLSTDPNLHVGKLPNGLTYYILRNNTPPNRANFYLAQCVGSLQESDNQRGLAHFLEHLCFNGTRHFPSNTLVAYLETLGLKFGQNINAYTGMERTVYHLNNVPTARSSALDSCLLALRDWVCDISLSPEEINKERGVINEEWRQRNSATARMLQRNLPRLYPNSLYARRAPIGLMEVIDTVGPSTLRQYYHRWYHPQNQAIIVVGDVDVARTAKRIEVLFAPIRPTKAARRPAIVPVADNAKPIVVVDSDAEQRTTLVQVFCNLQSQCFYMLKAMQLKDILILYHSKGDTITLKEWRSFSIFSVLLSSPKTIKATQEILHSLLYMAKKLFCFAPLFYISRIFMQQKLQNLSFLVKRTDYYFNFI